MLRCNEGSFEQSNTDFAHDNIAIFEIDVTVANPEAQIPSDQNSLK